MKTYRVMLAEEPGDKFRLVFDCWAEDADHAAEQAEDAYLGCDVKHVMEIPEIEYMRPRIFT